MENKLVIKMIKNCFKQYYSESNTLPMNQEELERLASKIINFKREHPAADLYEIINDVVYEFLTG